MALHVPDNLPLPTGLPPQTNLLHRPPVIMIQCIPPNHQYFALFGQMAEDVTRLFPTDTNLGAVDKELHVHTVVRDCHVRPLVWYVASIGVDGGRFVGTVSFKGEKETRVTIPMFTDRLDAEKPPSVTGGIEAFVV